MMEIRGGFAVGMPRALLIFALTVPQWLWGWIELLRSIWGMVAQ